MGVLGFIEEAPMIRISLRLLPSLLAIALCCASTAMATEESPCDAAKANFVSEGIRYMEGLQTSEQTIAELKEQLSWLQENSGADASCSSVITSQMNELIKDLSKQSLS